MVLHPFEASGPASERDSGGLVPAWQAVEKKQKQQAKEWLLISQVDHAQLAGDLAQRLQSPLLPRLGPDIVQAIAVHDAGWASFDDGHESGPFHPKLNDDGRPVSFLDVGPADFVVAWNSSIAEADRISPAAGFLVSRHFWRLGEKRLNSRIDDQENTSRLRQFLHAEAARQNRLVESSGYSHAELDTLTDVLQFCDLLSLYLCCGATESVEFPQTFRGTQITVRHEADMFQCKPAMFGDGVSLGIVGRLYGNGQGSRALAFLLK